MFITLFSAVHHSAAAPFLPATATLRDYAEPKPFS